MAARDYDETAAKLQVARFLEIGKQFSKELAPTMERHHLNAADSISAISAFVAQWAFVLAKTTGNDPIQVHASMQQMIDHYGTIVMAINAVQK